MAEAFFPLGFSLLMIAAATSDVMTRRISNRLMVLCAAAFFASSAHAGMPAWMVLEHSATALVLLGIGFGLFSFGLLGGGDAKLLAVVGLWLGFPPSVIFVGAATLAGGLLAFGMGLLYLAQVELAAWGVDLQRSRILPPSVPYGLALAAGAIVAMPYSWLLPPGHG